MSAAETTSCVRKGLRRRHGASGALASASGVHLRTHYHPAQSLARIWASPHRRVRSDLCRPTPTYVLALAHLCLQASNIGTECQV